MQSSIVVNDVRLNMRGAEAFMYGALIRLIVKSGDARELRLVAKDDAGASFTTAIMISPATTYVIHAAHDEEEFRDESVGQWLNENFRMLAVEYGLMEASEVESSGDSHGTTS
ncbi:hypothetical protein P9139_18040 [Curtobacterium flaccumfaciens]|nr:hypothetical protein P9139_18040 [Curtobacterium flaccumfaciens]